MSIRIGTAASGRIPRFGLEQTWRSCASFWSRVMRGDAKGVSSTGKRRAVSRCNELQRGAGDYDRENPEKAVAAGE
ncbi:hypothetical protein DF041_27915 [Burkholderia cepacia]|nr:hypothetical protein DF041_27915 [Burkholderia cepacia]